jgi:hypothetical protein
MHVSVEIGVFMLMVDLLNVTPAFHNNKILSN